MFQVIGMAAPIATVASLCGQAAYIGVGIVRSVAFSIKLIDISERAQFTHQGSASRRQSRLVRVVSDRPDRVAALDRRSLAERVRHSIGPGLRRDRDDRRRGRSAAAQHVLAAGLIVYAAAPDVMTLLDDLALCR